MKKGQFSASCKIQYWFILTLSVICFRTRLDQDAVIKVFGISFKDYCESLIKNAMASNASKVRSNFSFHQDIKYLFSLVIPTYFHVSLQQDFGTGQDGN